MYPDVVHECQQAQDCALSPMHERIRASVRAPARGAHCCGLLEILQENILVYINKKKNPATLELT